MSNQPNAFVLMPFDPEFNTIFDQLVRPALEEIGYEVNRADSFIDQQNILKDIIRGIARADLIIADLTTLNPNVLYELGLCHGLNKPTVLLTQSIDEVPFDIRGYRVQIYETRFDEVHKLIESLREIAQGHLEKKVLFGNPVADFYPSYITSFEAPEPDSESQPDEVPKGFVDYLVEGEKAAEAYSLILNELAEDTQAIGDRMSIHTKNITSLNENPGPGIASKMAKISSLIAADMNSSATKIEKVVPELDQIVEVLEESYIGYLNWFTPESKDQLKQLEDFRDSVNGLQTATEESIPQLSSYRDAIGGLPGISAATNRSCQRLSRNLDGLISIASKTAAFTSRAMALIDDKFIEFTD